MGENDQTKNVVFFKDIIIIALINLVIFNLPISALEIEEPISWYSKYRADRPIKPLEAAFIDGCLSSGGEFVDYPTGYCITTDGAVVLFKPKMIHKF